MSIRDGPPLHLEGRKLYQETRQLSCREEKSRSAGATLGTQLTGTR